MQITIFTNMFIVKNPAAAEKLRHKFHLAQFITSENIVMRKYYWPVKFLDSEMNFNCGKSYCTENKGWEMLHYMAMAVREKM